jgi:heme-degrading monooxygenase HmoA
VITEQAVLEVKQGREKDFEEAFATASSIIASTAGFVSLQLLRCVERPCSYLLLVEWETLEDHTEVFPKAAGYEDWKALLHHFYDPFPTVEHFSVVATA